MSLLDEHANEGRWPQDEPPRSEQPQVEDSPGREWIPEWIRLELGDTAAGSSAIIEGLNDAHNAALDAVKNNSTYQALGEKVQEIGRLKQQLATERDLRLQTELTCEQWIRQCEELQQQLADADKHGYHRGVRDCSDQNQVK